MAERTPATVQSSDDEWLQDETTDPIDPRNLPVHYDRETRTYHMVPRPLPNAVDIGQRILDASHAHDDSPEVQAIYAAGVGPEFQKVVWKIAAAAARAIRDDIRDATSPKS